jgi:hypothetical protein
VRCSSQRQTFEPIPCLPCERSLSDPSTTLSVKTCQTQPPHRPNAPSACLTITVHTIQCLNETVVPRSVGGRSLPILRWWSNATAKRPGSGGRRNIEESQSEASQMYRKAVRIWKVGKTALNPLSHVNNIESNLTPLRGVAQAVWRLNASTFPVVQASR